MKILLLITLLYCNSSFATLGEKFLNNKPLVLTQKSAVSKVISLYSVNEYVENTITIKEYCNSSGFVFAISWSGIAHPDLESLLGKYWPEYAESPKQGARRIPMTKTETENIVVEKSGRMRMVTGKAYVPSLIPEGVSVNELN